LTIGAVITENVLSLTRPRQRMQTQANVLFLEVPFTAAGE
jgi:hypothetical protein